MFDIIFIGFQCSDSKSSFGAKMILSDQLVVETVFVINGTGYDFYNYTPPEIQIEKTLFTKSGNLQSKSIRKPTFKGLMQVIMSSRTTQNRNP